MDNQENNTQSTDQASKQCKCGAKLQNEDKTQCSACEYWSSGNVCVGYGPLESEKK